jgi:hypothetical protein
VDGEDVFLPKYPAGDIIFLPFLPDTVRGIGHDNVYGSPISAFAIIFCYLLINDL